MRLLSKTHRWAVCLKYKLFGSDLCCDVAVETPVQREQASLYWKQAVTRAAVWKSLIRIRMRFSIKHNIDGTAGEMRKRKPKLENHLVYIMIGILRAQHASTMFLVP